MTVENLEIKVRTDADEATKELLSAAQVIEKIAAASMSVNGNAKGAAKGISKIGEAAKKANKPLGNFISSLKRIAFYRFIRSIIKSITQAFQEGLEKAYQFSAGMSDSGNRFAAAMDNIKSSGNQMKAQLGSAFISLLTAIQPILVTIINLVTKVADALSQLFAAFTGTTYLKANATAAKFADTMKSGAGSAKEWKNQLLGFDEINRLNEPSGGGGGGGVNPLDGYSMDSAPISDFWMEVANKLRPIFEDIRNMFQGLSDFIKGAFTGDWGLAFQGLGAIVEGFGQLVNHVLTGFIIPTLDGFSGQVIFSIDKLLQRIEEETGLNLTKVREDVAYSLNYTRFLIEGFAIQAGWIIQDLCLAVSEALQGNWHSAWDAAKKAVDDAKMDIIPQAQDMAITVTDSMLAGGNASADFAEAFSANLETVRSQMASLGQSSLSVNETANGISFTARIVSAVARILRFGRTPLLFGGGFASGGFPTDGQLFLANEGSAPEMVGLMGGRTAVANNDQIVEGIRQGVYDAVVAANSNSGGDVSVKVYLDSREIRAGQQRLARAWG